MVSDDDRELHTPWCERIGWLLLIWLLGVGALGAVALALILVMRLVGLTP